MPVITKDNYNDVSKFVSDNIEEYNQSSKLYEYNKIKEQYDEIKKKYKKQGCNIDITGLVSASDIRLYLKKNFDAILSDAGKKAALIQQLKDIEADGETEIDRKICEIANPLLVSKDDVANLYRYEIHKHIISQCDENLEENKTFIDRIKAYADSFSSNHSSAPSSFLQKDIDKYAGEALYWLLAGGFYKNLTFEVEGIYNANAGDSAQFIFVARAILAGYNCSNVDVRSSSYDAIISRPNTSGSASNLKTVQVKGITTGEALRLVKRARGGSGSDSKQGRNKTQYLSSKDADILVAVDKRFGTCYLIPMTEVDAFIADGKKSISWSRLKKYKETWEETV